MQLVGFFVSLFFTSVLKFVDEKRGNLIKKDMAKVQKISELAPTFKFTEFELFERYKISFAKSDLGKLHSTLPLKELAKKFGLTNTSLRCGRKSYFSPEGKVALMFLKAYTNLSDSKLLSQLNSCIHSQLFCDISINPADNLTNSKIISDIRCELGNKLNINKLQETLAQHWKPYLENLHVCMSDATCYESHVRYPTNMKLLWENCKWLMRWIKKLCKRYNLRQPRNKYSSIEARYLSHSINRKRKKSRTKVLTRSLLNLCSKLSKQLTDILNNKLVRRPGTKDFIARRKIINIIISQQTSILIDGIKIPNRIVSLGKDYLRPIVRGKETKSVEFGAKCNNIQVDGISFIQKISFDAFHEGILAPNCIMLQERLFNKKVSQFAGDKAYGTNANRKYCTANNIYTSFVRKGKASSDEAQKRKLRSILGKERATRLEGSFGTQKQFYSLQKIKAKTKKTELLWIFFGIHTANASVMIKKIENHSRADIEPEAA